MTRINVNLSRDTHEELKIYATRKNLNLDEAAEELLSKVLNLVKKDSNEIEKIVTFGEMTNKRLESEKL